MKHNMMMRSGFDTARIRPNNSKKAVHGIREWCVRPVLNERQVNSSHPGAQAPEPPITFAGRRNSEGAKSKKPVRIGRYRHHITGRHIQQHQLTQSSSVRSVDGQPPLAATDATRRVRAARRYMVSVLGVSLTISHSTARALLELAPEVHQSTQQKDFMGSVDVRTVHTRTYNVRVSYVQHENGACPSSVCSPAHSFSIFMVAPVATKSEVRRNNNWHGNQRSKNRPSRKQN